jgi:peptidoglycan/xylan/chitin deacetylase (PgdA/CDA1 family)
MGEFINTDECIKMLKGERAINGKYFHLSFDDGFRNNYLNAFPILKKHAVPTLFFVPSAIIGADWSTTREYCLKTTRYRSIIEMMNWNDLRALTQDGYEIGSHTRTHARFSDISHSTQLMSEEILGSKAEIETQLGIPCKYISWPYGQLKDADTISLETVKSAGYTACFGAFRGTVSAEKTDIFSIPRHHFEAQWPLSHIKYFARGNLEKNLDQHRIMT